MMAAQSAVARPAASSSVGWAIEMPARSVVGILGLWLGQAESYFSTLYNVNVILHLRKRNPFNCCINMFVM